ncbi:hypothetical protein Vretifemale_11369 [Volvox reticuliferus]|uniref:Uncharacterized protein n=1 Tax=Volvox reticuliferus TaxID=1737510 RepID=A0A8J4CIR5_9CHLO|nr:hypothetical protein Vretifemale_11369 [Volvox reticuliferus]
MDQRIRFPPSARMQPYRSHRRACIRVPHAAPTTGEAPWRSVLGPESRLPNVYWGALSLATLRRKSYFTALQPVDQVLLGSEATYCYVRQDTALWSALHAGRLTTSRLKDALGLRDRTAARIVGGPQYPELGVLKAYTHLLQPPYTPSPPPPPTPLQLRPPTAPSAKPCDEAGGAQRSETEFLELNESARLQFNAELQIGAISAPGEPDFGVQVRPQTNRKASGDMEGDVLTQIREGSTKASADEQDDWSTDDRRRISELAALAVGAAGAVRMNLLWGNLQEAAAVATLAVLFPTSRLEEVGLLCLRDSSPWSIELNDLPPIGASPDALITHYVPITHGDIQVARSSLTAVLRGHGSGDCHFKNAVPSAARDAVRQVARSVLRSALVRHTQCPRAAATERDAAEGGPYAATLPSPNCTSRGLPISSWGPSLPLHSYGWEEALDWLSAAILCPSEKASGIGSASSTEPTPPKFPSSPSIISIGTHQAAQQEQPPPQQQQRQASRDQHAFAGYGKSGDHDDDVVAVIPLREVVEVKNHCPFVYKGQRKARKRGLVIDYVVRDRGPIKSVWPLWVPQLQAHMACSGAESALLLSRSASKGIRLFRMFRDDSYIEAAFDILRELQYSQVARKQPPGSDPWVGRAGYEDFVQHTVEVACGAETVVVTSVTPQLPGTDHLAFWSLK